MERLVLMANQQNTIRFSLPNNDVVLVTGASIESGMLHSMEWFLIMALYKHSCYCDCSVFPSVTLYFC